MTWLNALFRFASGPDHKNELEQGLKMARQAVAEPCAWPTPGDAWPAPGEPRAGEIIKDTRGLARYAAGSVRPGPEAYATQPDAGQTPRRVAGEAFLTWLRTGMASWAIACNRANAPVHVIAEGVFLASPRIFRLFVNQHPEYRTWEEVQRSFQKLQVNYRSVSGKNVFTCRIHGKASPERARRSKRAWRRSVINGWIVPTELLFGAGQTPPLNPHLSLFYEPRREHRREHRGVTQDTHAVGLRTAEPSPGSGSGGGSSKQDPPPAQIAHTTTSTEHAMKTQNARTVNTPAKAKPSRPPGSVRHTRKRHPFRHDVTLEGLARTVMDIVKEMEQSDDLLAPPMAVYDGLSYNDYRRHRALFLNKLNAAAYELYPEPRDTGALIELEGDTVLTDGTPDDPGTYAQDDNELADIGTVVLNTFAQYASESTKAYDACRTEQGPEDDEYTVTRADPMDEVEYVYIRNLLASAMDYIMSDRSFTPSCVFAFGPRSPDAGSAAA